MSFVPTSFRPLARSGWGGRAEFRGQTRGQTRGQIGTVVFRSNGPSVTPTITGVTRDSSGNPLGNCELDLFLTDVDMLVQQQTSDASGNFSFTNPGSGPFYIVAYKPGAPDVAGTTVSTLVAV